MRCFTTVSLCFLWFLSYHSDKMGTVQNQQHRVSSLTSQLYLFRDGCILSLSRTRHRAWRVPVNIYTIQEQYKQFGTLRAKGKCPLSSSQAGYRKVLKSYFTCLTGNISQNVDSNPKPQHSSVLLCARLPTSPYKGADRVLHYQRT